MNLFIKILALTAFLFALSYGLKFFMKYIRDKLSSAELKWKVDPQIFWVTERFGTIAIVIIGAVLILQLLGINIMPLIAFGGIGAAAVGFAAKDIIGNFCSGIMIYVSRPFSNGDSILLPEKNVDAVVEEIGWFVTAVRDKEKRPLYLPNSVFSQQIVINASRMSHRRILEKINVRYEDFTGLRKLTESIRNSIAKHSRIDARLPILVYFYSFHEYSFEIQVDVYTLATRYEEYLAVKEEVLALIYEVILAHGAQLPFPTMTLHTPP